MGGIGSGRKIEIEPGSEAARQLLDQWNFTLSNLAEFLGVDRSTLWLYLTGARLPLLPFALTVAESFRIDPALWRKKPREGACND